MNNLVSALRYSPESGEPLPTPFRSVAALGAHHRRGQVSLVASASGGGKTAYATHVAVNAAYNYPSEPDPVSLNVMYFSADTDKATFGSRAAAGILNTTIESAETALHRNDRAVWAAIEASTGHIWLDWNPGPSLDYIGEEVQAYGIAKGHYPDLIVVDNLLNIDDGAGEASSDGLERSIQEFKRLAVNCDAHVMILHHVGGEYVNGDQPIPKKGLLYKVDKHFRLILTLWRPSEELMGVCVIKNTMGRADSNGNYGTQVGWLPGMSYFTP